MDNQPSFDRGLLIPALISVFSVIGIVSVLLFNRYNTARAAVTGTPTETPFKYILLGTEPAISTEALPEESATARLSEEPPPVFTQAPPIVLTPNTPQVTTPNTPVTPLLTPSSPTITPASASPPPLNAGTYDDVYPGLIYSEGWDLTNVGGVTLHTSSTLGNSVTFRFIGQEVRILYQSGPSLGVVRVMLDTTQTLLNQSATSNELVLTAATSGTHTVTITHLSGGSVNLDSVIIPSVGTPTATATPTSTP
jgi:hypothetical protein